MTKINQKMVDLRDIAEIRSGIGFPLALQGREKGDFPFAKVGDISNQARCGSNFISDAPNWVTNEDISTLKTKTFPSGTVVFAKIGEAIRQNFKVVTNRPMLFDNNVMGVIPNTTLIDTKFLLFYLKKLDFYYLTEKTTVPSIRKSRIESLKIPLPSLEEQRRIATILDKADSIRRKRQEAIRLTEELLRSQFLEMFGDPVTNPKGWETAELEKLCNRVTDGTHQPPEWANKGVPFLFVSNIVDGEIDFNVKKFITEASWKSLTSRCPIEINDILYTTVGSYGNAALVRIKDKFCFQRHIAHIKPNSQKIHPEFLLGAMQSEGVRRQADRQVRGIAQKTLNLRELKKFKIIFPPLSKQEEYVTFRRKIERYLYKQKQAFENQNNLFNSLLQRAFRGEL